MPVYRIIISGKVQGVFYRATAQKKAEALGIKGWIRNMDSGKVEALIEATETAAHAFIEWCKQGPALAKVRDVKIIETDELPLNSGFIIIH